MARKRATKKFFYFYDQHLHLREVKWVRLKLAAVVAISLTVGVAAILLFNHLVYDFLGVGYDRVATLMKENTALHGQVTKFSSRIKELEGTIRRLNDQGNRLRLLVDLPSIDEATRSAGTGGAVTEPAMDFEAGTTSTLLHSLSAQLEKLSSEVKLQEQSYSQILKKHEANKAYFSALPALKPMEGFYSTREFGRRMHPVLGIFKSHEGLDIVNDVGTPVYAAADGVVEMSGHSGGGYGIVVVIRHGFGYQTLYAHLSRTMVREGHRVTRGQMIAKSGKTGLVTGPHLHYEVRRNGVRMNPVDYFFDDVSARDLEAQVATR